MQDEFFHVFLHKSILRNYFGYMQEVLFFMN